MAINQLGDGATDGVQLPNTKVGFFGAAPVAPQTPAANAHTTAAGATTTVFTNTTFDGGISGTSYTVGDIVAVLKTLGLFKT